MEVLRKNKVIDVLGGTLVNNAPSNDALYDSIKLMITQARGQPGFDETAAALALIKIAPQDFWSLDVAYHYVKTGNMTFPVTYRLNNYLTLSFFHIFTLFF